MRLVPIGAEVRLMDTSSLHMYKSLKPPSQPCTLYQTVFILSLQRISANLVVSIFLAYSALPLHFPYALSIHPTFLSR
jgi:hypothetical protein